jgi:hypothetical protein
MTTVDKKYSNGSRKKNFKNIGVVEKINTMNPDMKITRHKHNGIPFSVFRDDYLEGGTKQRALLPYLKKYKKYNKFVYAGPSTGFAQLAIAITAKKLNKTAVLFLDGETNITKKALSHGSVELHKKHFKLKQIQKMADDYVSRCDDCFQIAFGGYEKIYMNLLYAAIKKSLKNTRVNPKRIWIVAGSATILNVLYRVFPKSKFMVVQVGKKIWPDQLDEKRTTLFISKEKFNSVANEQPPYPSVATYDAKLWVFFKQHMKKSDYIWNVAADT